MSYLLLLANVLLLVCGQVLFKFGLNQMGENSILSMWKAVYNPYIIFGLFLYGIATYLWFIVLTRIPLSVAYPLQSMAYVLGVLVAWLLFHEEINFYKWAGIVVIMIGAFLISYKP